MPGLLPSACDQPLFELWVLGVKIRRGNEGAALPSARLEPNGAGSALLLVREGMGEPPLSSASSRGGVLVASGAEQGPCCGSLPSEGSSPAPKPGREDEKSFPCRLGALCAFPGVFSPQGPWCGGSTGCSAWLRRAEGLIPLPCGTRGGLRGVVCIWAPLFWPPNSWPRRSGASLGACSTSSAVPEKQEGDAGARCPAGPCEGPFGAAPALGCRSSSLWGPGGARGGLCSVPGLLLTLPPSAPVPAGPVRRRES